MRLTLILLLSSLANIHAEPWMSEEGKAMHIAHRFLFGEFSTTHAPELSGEASDPGGRVLNRIRLANPEHKIGGASEIELPAGAEQVLGFMRYIELHGTGLDTLGPLRLLPAAPGSNLNVSSHTATLYRVKVPALAAPDKDTPRMRLSLEGKAQISRIDLVPFGGGIREEFDRAPHINLGHDQPVRKLKLDLDLEHELSIEGHVELDRTKWFRYYGKPTSLPGEMERFAIERNFLPGRQILKFEPALERGYSKNDPKLKEDPARPGYADPAFFKAYRSTSFDGMNEAGYPAEMNFAMCFNDYPSFMSHHPGGRGTPKVEHFDAAADLVARFLKNQIEHSGRTATWWELKNEASIKAEWDYHWTKDTDSWGLLADFHNRVADRVHRDVPGVKIVGPASAWMQLQAGGFKLWQNQARFMDLTKGHLDLYSHHFYEDAGTLGAHDRRQRGYTNYLLGRLDATLDLFRAHMVATDNVKPMLITECGALNIGGSSADYWLRLRTYSAFITQFMGRPHQIDLIVPFIFLHAPWDPTNAHSAFHRNGKASRLELAGYDRTPCAHLFDLWRDFRGRRLPISSPDKYVRTVALHGGDKVFVAISNMSGSRLAVDLGVALPAVQRRLYRLNGEIRFEDGTAIDPARIPLEVEETTIVILTLPEPLEPKGTIGRRTFYSPTTVTKERRFIIPASGFETAKSAELRIGLQNSGGLGVPLRGTINGHPFEHDTSWAKGVSNLFEHAIIPVAPQQLKAENAIVIEGLDEATTITEVNLRLETTK